MKSWLIAISVYLKTDKGFYDAKEYFRAILLILLTVAGAIAIYHFLFE